MPGITRKRGIAGEDSGYRDEYVGRCGGASEPEANAFGSEEGSGPAGRDPQGSGGDPEVCRTSFEKLTNILARRRTFLLLLTAIALIIFAKPTVTSFFVGLPLVIAGALVRIWASGYISKCDALATDGPYSLMRNPLYFGSLLIAVGYCAMSGQPLAWAIIVPMFFATHGSAIMWEEKFLIGKFGQDFADYCDRVPRWFPKPPAKGTFGGGHVSWAQVKYNREHKQSLGTLVVVAIFAVRLFLSYRH